MVSINSKWMILNSCKDVDSSKNVKKLTKPFKYNCKALSYMCFNMFFNKCKMQFVNIGFNILNVNGLFHVHVEN